MKILVTGATGFIGRRLLEALKEKGHTAAALSRNPDRARSLLPGVKAARWDPVLGPPAAGVLEGADAVVHLAGETVAGSWRRAGKKAALRESRILGTRNLVQGILRARNRPAVLVSASAIGYYGSRGEAELAEDAGAGEGFLAALCRDWEREARAAAASASGLRVVLPRIGVVLGKRGGALEAMLPLFRRGWGGPIGGGRQWWAWIHSHDLAALLLHLIEHPVEGPVNAAAPEPLRQREFARRLGKALGKPAFLPAPAFALRLALGGFAEELLSSRRVVPRKALASGFSFRFPSLDEALADLVD